jgi:toxin ParE1/3/4
MATLRFSRSAKADLLSIGAYTLQTWSAAQAERYLKSLEHCAKMLAGNPLLGRRCDWIRPGLYRFEKGRHVLFYRREGDGILISRILHQNMLPERQPFEDADPDAGQPRSGGS